MLRSAAPRSYRSAMIPTSTAGKLSSIQLGGASGGPARGRACGSGQSRAARAQVCGSGQSRSVQPFELMKDASQKVMITSMKYNRQTNYQTNHQTTCWYTFSTGFRYMSDCALTYREMSRAQNAPICQAEPANACSWRSSSFLGFFKVSACIHKP